ncbi:MAG: tRNA (guanosine(46)-N7)-methyltransferase TrmB [Prevotellaceae bacterium]|nr:tRNA (guanosine(46)-N7)-methyltransferase TrmB [Prevotellaceae bacterium]
MGKNKHRRFRENETFAILHQPPFADYFRRAHPLRGTWRAQIFGNPNPIVLELGCGKGEYTLALAQKYPQRNYIGVDIKGARLWRGAKTATEQALPNVRFLRARIEHIDALFAPSEIDEIWITFPDPQPKNPNKRLTSPPFLNRYRLILKPAGAVHLKTDSRPLHDYTLALIAHNRLTLNHATPDLYAAPLADDLLAVKTHYEKIYLLRSLPITYLQFLLDAPAPLTDAPSSQ